MLQQQFATLAQQNIFERVSGWMREMYGELAYPVPDSASVTVTLGSTRVWVNVAPWGDNDAAIAVRSGVAFEISLSPDLMYFLLARNAECSFGAFGIIESGIVVFEHGLLGSTCDKDELRNSIATVSWTADEYDDMIVSRWGGKRTADL